MDTEITIIGSGVIGLAIASELAGSERSIYILEKNDRHGTGISSRNSEVIHAGIYYPAQSLKATLCVEGNRRLYEICMKNNIPHKRIGKLIIATSANEMGEIERLFRNARDNGVSSVSLLAQGAIHDLEPYIKAIGAVYSPETGIISVHSLMDYYLHDARMKGAEIVYGTQVIGIERLSGGYRVITVNSREEEFSFDTECLINAAGLYSADIARMISKEYTLHYCKGDYFSINNVKHGTVQRLIYPVPEEHHTGLGIHLTLDLNGRLRLGPDTAYIEKTEDYRVDAAKGEKFYMAAVRYLPFIRREDLVPDMSGIRPKLQGPGEGFRDFVIREDLPGFVNLVGIESPGLTAAPAIARYVRKLLHLNSS